MNEKQPTKGYVFLAVWVYEGDCPKTSVPTPEYCFTEPSTKLSFLSVEIMAALLVVSTLRLDRCALPCLALLASCNCLVVALVCLLRWKLNTHYLQKTDNISELNVFLFTVTPKKKVKSFHGSKGERITNYLAERHLSLVNMFVRLLHDVIEKCECANAFWLNQLCEDDHILAYWFNCNHFKNHTPWHCPTIQNDDMLVERHYQPAYSIQVISICNSILSLSSGRQFQFSKRAQHLPPRWFTFH